MSHAFADLVFTANVKAEQASYGSLAQNSKLQADFGPNDALDVREIDFIAQRNSFYMATVSETGWPYVQHRGGPVGFLKIAGPQQIAFADYRGNTQLVSTGNLRGNTRCALILVDYTHRRRLKLLGQAHVQSLVALPRSTRDLLVETNYSAKVERAIVIDILAFDWNCPQHIARRYTMDEIARIDTACAENLFRGGIK